MNLNRVLETLLYTVSTNTHEILQVLTSCCFPNGSNSKVNVSFIYSSYHFYFDIFRLNSSHCLFNRMGHVFFPLSKSSPIDELSHFHAFILPFICVGLYLYISLSMDETMELSFPFREMSRELFFTAFSLFEIFYPP